MAEWAELLRAVAALLWPLITLTGIVIFRRQIRELLGRIKRGKLLGQEIELSESLAQLDASAAAAESEVAALPHATEPAMRPELEHVEENVVGKVLDVASRSPKAALLLLASEIEREVRHVLAASALALGKRHLPVREAIDLLSANMELPRHVTSSVRLFWDVRNNLVHGGAGRDDDVLAAIDSGIAILRALRSIPREKHVVHHPGVTVYGDARAERPLEGVKGLILEVTSPGGARTGYRIYPTTRTHYKKGMAVAWEWSSDKRFGEAWYRDPDTGEIKSAWTSSYEFVGRNIEDLI